MKEDEIERLIEKYKEGNSTLNEEQFLFEHIKSSEPSLEVWSTCLLYTSPSPRDQRGSRMPSSA